MEVIQREYAANLWSSSSNFIATDSNELGKTLCLIIQEFDRRKYARANIKIFNKKFDNL